LWQKFDPLEVASLGVFQSHPEKFYGWLRPLLQGIWTAQPNPAHLALARLETAGIIKAVITQNIDNLHHRAGSSTIYEVHGSLRTMTCLHCGQTYPSEQFQAQMADGGSSNGGMPHCPKCSQVLKPDITLFDEMLPVQTWQEAEDHCRLADVMLVAGSSLEVWPAASLPEFAFENGARLIINNLSPTHLDTQADVLLPLDVAEALPELAKRIL
jgi:NAD-dependent deacetylase